MLRIHLAEPFGSCRETCWQRGCPSYDGNVGYLHISDLPAAQHLRGWEERRQAIAQAADRPAAPATCWRVTASLARP